MPRDGVVALPQARAEQVVAAGQRREAEEAAMLRRLQVGETTMAVYGSK